MDQRTPMREWASPSPTKLAAWQEAVARLLASADPPSVSCPICGQSDIRRFFMRAGSRLSPHRGSVWVWCPACSTFEHGSTTVPEWWRDRVGVSPNQLTPEPEYLEEHWDEIR